MVKLRGTPIEFAVAGQDAVSLVNSLRVLWKKFKLKAVNTQITAFPRPKCTLFVADAEANKVRLIYLELSQTVPTVSQVVTTSQAKISKDLNHYTPLAIFGPNIVVSEGDEWKKYRKISAPAFSEVCLEFNWLTKI